MMWQVLLKGSHSDELKKIKYVVQCAVVIAHHLMLETSFIVDQRAMFSTMPFAVVADVWQTVEQCPTSKNGNLNVPCLDDSTAETESGITTDIPISSGLHEDTSDENPAKEGEAVLSSQPYNPVIFSGFSALSASLKKVIGDNFPLKSAAVCPSISTYLGLCEKEPNGKITEKNPATDISEAPDICEIEIRNSSVKEMSQDGQLPSMSVCSETPLNLTKTCGADNNQLQNKEGANAALDSQSILVLMSCRNALKGTVCEQSHFSHIMFYKNFDIPLGKFLQDNLLNQVIWIYIYWETLYISLVVILDIIFCSLAEVAAHSLKHSDISLYQDAIVVFLMLTSTLQFNSTLILNCSLDVARVAY